MRELDLALALEILNRELGIERLLLDEGGKSNGSFLRASRIDEISLAVCSGVAGARGGPYAFDSRRDETDARTPVHSMRLRNSLASRTRRSSEGYPFMIRTGKNHFDLGRAVR